MKKAILSLSLCAIMLVTACSKPIDEVSLKVKNDIDSIGTVEAEDEKLIEKIEDTYKTLTDSQKEQVPNYATLLVARDKLDEILEAQRIAEEEAKKAQEEALAEELRKAQEEAERKAMKLTEEEDGAYISIIWLSRDFKDSDNLTIEAILSKELYYSTPSNRCFAYAIVYSTNDTRDSPQVDYSKFSTLDGYGSNGLNTWERTGSIDGEIHELDVERVMRMINDPVLYYDSQQW